MLKAEIKELSNFLISNLFNYDATVMAEIEEARQLMSEKQQRVIKNTNTIYKLRVSYTN